MRCLLYTSDAADERSSVDLGGRRIIKKKKKKTNTTNKQTHEKNKAGKTYNGAECSNADTPMHITHTK